MSKENVRKQGLSSLNRLKQYATKESLDNVKKFLYEKEWARYNCYIGVNEDGSFIVDTKNNGWEYTIEFLPDGMIEFSGIKLDKSDEFGPIVYSKFCKELLDDFDDKFI